MKDVPFVWRGQIPGQPRRTSAVLFTDGSVDPNRLRIYGFGWVGTDGTYGFGANRQSNGTTRESLTTLAELAAVGAALSQANVRSRHMVHINCDSASAIGYLRRWQHGELHRHPSYEPSPFDRGLSNLDALARFLQMQRNVHIHKIQGHSGEPLNDCADRLAKLGRHVIAGNMTLDEAAALAQTKVAKAFAIRAAQRQHQAPIPPTDPPQM